jgi:hypothetical protein
LVAENRFSGAFFGVSHHPWNKHGQKALDRLAMPDQSMPASMIVVSNAGIYALTCSCQNMLISSGAWG